MDLSIIKGMTTINDLVYYDKIIRTCCKNVISNNEYEDIVQNMYICVDRLMKRGKVIDGGYVFVTMKNININLIKKNSKFIKEELFDIIDYEEYDSNYYDSVDLKIEKLDLRLKTFLTDYEVSIYKFYQLNTLKETSKFFNIDYKTIRNDMRRINNEIRYRLGNNFLEPNEREIFLDYLDNGAYYVSKKYNISGDKVIKKLKDKIIKNNKIEL